MTAKTQEQFFACGMTILLLILLGLIAAWVKVHSDPPKLRPLSLTESFASVTGLPPTPIPPKPAEPVPQRRMPEMLEVLVSSPSVTAPLQRTHPGDLQLQQVRTPLSARQRISGRTSVSLNTAYPDTLTARAIPNTSALAVHGSHAVTAQQRPRQAPQTAMNVTGRANPSGTSLEIESLPVSTRVLEASEAKEIVQWIRVTQSELPPGIQRHVGYRPGNLTAAALLDHEGEPWEIYLMARMPSEELHVVIVRDSATYYVVDPSFQRDGRRFRVGTARRADGVITGITSEERAAASREAVRHYDVFLAWWDNLRLTLQ